MITKFDTNYCFDQAFNQAVQAYKKHFRSQCQSIILPPEQTIRASWEKISNRLTPADETVSGTTV